MIKVLTTAQVRAADAYTIEHEPIASIDLMERASIAFTRKFEEVYPNGPVTIFCGTGNNGGDGLVVARLLASRCERVYAIGDPDMMSPDFSKNLKRLPQAIKWLKTEEDFPQLKGNQVIIDALFGSGLTRPVTGLYGSLIDCLNENYSQIISLDIASGLLAETPPSTEGSIIQPEHTISFQTPKLAFFQPSLSPFVGEFHIVDIGLDTDFMAEQQTHYNWATAIDFLRIRPVRGKFDHKGSAGRVQLVVGSAGKIGAGILSARSAIRSGAGLLFVQVPEVGSSVLHQSVPEAMVVTAEGNKEITKVERQSGVDVFGIGPGLGTERTTADAFEHFLLDLNGNEKLVLDADALNILSQRPSLLGCLPPETILTPHPGEFKRLVGDWKDDYQKLEKLRRLCTDHRLNVVLKGAYSAVCSSDGQISFNSSGNPGMATAGSGDVLLGMITALRGQRISAIDALRLGVYLHGSAGDIASQGVGQVALIASDIVNAIPKALLKLDKLSSDYKK